jgi:molybdenum cofactor cytidylyltransferase
MMFGTVPLSEAIGALLAHSVVLPGGALKKGRRLSADDIARLTAHGVTSVMVARPAADDVLEDVAAARIAQALGGPGVRVAEAFTGRANLYATAGGLLRIDALSIAALNGIDEGVTLATLPALERVEAGQMVATVKIIPFAVSAASVAAAEAVARSTKVQVAAFAEHRVGLILTTLPGTKPNVLAKRREAIEIRLGQMRATLGAVRTVPHTTEAVADAMGEMQSSGGGPLLVFAASAIVDRADVIPAGLIAAGGRIERLGMPVDPGNLLLLGSLRETTVIGIPSCAASPKLNGFDWVLERVLAGIPVTSTDIAAMGVGGLLKEIASRPQPRAGGDVVSMQGRHASRIAVLVLAAGRSSRMGSNKLLEPLSEKPIVRHVVEAARASSAAEVIVVTGNRGDDVRAALAGPSVTFVDNPHFADGISSSLRAGLAAVGGDVDGVLVTLGDMPEITAQHLDRLIAAFSPADNRTIVVPTRGGKRGNPVLWSRLYFAEMAAVTGDTGAKHLLGLYGDQVAEVDLNTDAVLTDIDTPDALAALRARVAGVAPSRA